MIRYIRINIQKLQLFTYRMLSIDIEHTYSIYLIPEKVQSVRLVIVI